MLRNFAASTVLCLRTNQSGQTAIGDRRQALKPRSEVSIEKLSTSVSIRVICLFPPVSAPFSFQLLNGLSAPFPPEIFRNFERIDCRHRGDEDFAEGQE